MDGVVGVNLLNVVDRGGAASQSEKPGEDTDGERRRRCEHNIEATEEQCTGDQREKMETQVVDEARAYLLFFRRDAHVQHRNAAELTVVDESSKTPLQRLPLES